MALETFDFGLFQGSEGADLAIAADDLAVDASLRTAIVISLFSDRRAEPEDVIPDGTDNPRGYWADTAEDRWGSRLWLLQGAKLVPETAARARAYAEEALAWLVTDRVAKSVQVAASLEADHIRLELELTRGPEPRFSSVWDALEEEELAGELVRVHLLVR